MVYTTRNEPTVKTGSIPTSSGEGSAIIEGLYSDVRWLSISGTNAGSTFGLELRDGEDFLIQRSLPHTGEYSLLSSFPVSGTLVMNVSGTQVDGTYYFRVAHGTPGV